MSRELQSIGFDYHDAGDAEAMLARAVREGQALRQRHGWYTRWAPGAAIEIWVQLGPWRELLGFSQHFAGEARMRMTLEDATYDRRAPLEGCFYGRPAAATGHPCAPFVFHAPDFLATYHQLTFPATVSVQLAAFARRVTCGDGGQAPNDDGFYPLGLYTSDEEPGMLPRPELRFSGHILRADLRINPVTEQPFYTLLVDTAAGTVDVVANPEAVEGIPEVGVRVRTECWLSGRIADIPAVTAPSFFGRLLGKR